MTYTNPILPGFHPDPSVCRVGDDYYLVTSSFEYAPGLPLFHSRDLVNWTPLGHVLTRPSQLDLTKAWTSGGLYAPTLRHHQGRFYLTVTNVSDRGNFVVTADDARGPWSDPVWIDFPGIDPSLFFDDDGTVWYTGTGGVDMESAIWGFAVDLATGKPLTTPQVVWKGTGGAHPEGPHLWKRNGWYYLVLSEGGTEHGHMLTCARSRQPLGPWEPCPHNPLLTNRSLRKPVKAVGHADFVQTPQGDWWAVCLAIRPLGYPEVHTLGRETFLVPMRWDGEWPELGDQGTVDLTMDGPLTAAPRPQQPFVDTFAGPAWDPRWSFLRAYDAAVCSRTDHPGALTLWGQPGGFDATPVAWVGRRQVAHVMTVTVTLNWDGGPGEAGLSVYQNARHHYDVGVRAHHGRRRLFVRRQIGSLVADEAQVDAPDGPLTLGIEADTQEYRFFVQAGPTRIALGRGETRYLSTEVGGMFTGVFWALWATGSGTHPAVFRDFAEAFGG